MMAGVAMGCHANTGGEVAFNCPRGRQFAFAVAGFGEQVGSDGQPL